MVSLETKVKIEVAVCANLSRSITEKKESKSLITGTAVFVTVVHNQSRIERTVGHDVRFFWPTKTLLKRGERT